MSTWGERVTDLTTKGRERLIQLEISDQIVGTSLAGDVLLTIPGTHVTEERLAEALGCDAKDLELKGHVVRQKIQELRPVLCRRRTHRRWGAHRPAVQLLSPARWRFEPSLGEGTVYLDLSQLPPDGAIQALREKRLFVTREGPSDAFWPLGCRWSGGFELLIEPVQTHIKREDAGSLWKVVLGGRAVQLLQDLRVDRPDRDCDNSFGQWLNLPVCLAVRGPAGI